GFTEKFENITFNDDFVVGRTISFDPKGDVVAFFARKGKRRSLFLVSPLTGKIVRSVPLDLDQAQAPCLLPDGRHALLSAIKDDDIYTRRSLDLRTGVVKQFTDALGGNMAPAVLRSKGTEKVAFISYFKGEFRLQTVEPTEALKEVDQEVEVASDESIVDFQPDVVHQVIPQNKRKKHTFEKLFLEGRPPLNVGVTSGGDFFGGSQVALSDVLGDHNFLFTAMSLREFRSYEGTYINLSRRLHWGCTGFDDN